MRGFSVCLPAVPARYLTSKLRGGIREILQTDVALPPKGFVRIHRTINRLFISNELAILEAECFYLI